MSRITDFFSQKPLRSKLLSEAEDSVVSDSSPRKKEGGEGVNDFCPVQPQNRDEYNKNSSYCR